MVAAPWPTASGAGTWQQYVNVPEGHLVRPLSRLLSGLLKICMREPYSGLSKHACVPHSVQLPQATQPVREIAAAGMCGRAELEALWPGVCRVTGTIDMKHNPYFDAYHRPLQQQQACDCSEACMLRRFQSRRLCRMTRRRSSLSIRCADTDPTLLGMQQSAARRPRHQLISYGITS